MDTMKEIINGLKDVILRECKKENPSPEEITALTELAKVFVDYLQYDF